ncbi:MAG TPA: hypothetical protein VM925_25400 [Labilithrix sp.]|nr:hypothetical protein [Labilithrix sp.]
MGNVASGVVRIRRATLGLAITTTLSVMVSREAHAGDMDPTPERFINQRADLPPGQTCQSIAANPGPIAAAGLRPQDFSCLPNNQAFANMIAELGFAIAPTSFYPARTTGIGGFQVSLEASYTRISADRSVPQSGGGSMQYWHLGTRGPQDQNTKQSSILNSSPDGVLQVYALKARKGLPFGFELAGSLGYVSNTTLWAFGGDLRWSMLEGFRTGPLGYLPDISIGGGIRTVTGTSRFYLSTLGIDVRASKPIALQDSSQLIPSVGFQRLIIFGDSNVVDSTPNVDAAAQCGYAGLDPTTGAPSCRNKLPNGSDANGDFSNNFTFNKVRVHRNRALVALNYRYEIVWLGSQFAFDINEPKDENPQLVGSRQWTLSFEGGVHF